MIVVKGKKYITVQDAVEVTGRSKFTIYQQYLKWKWKPFRYGPQILFDLEKVEQWVADQLGV